MIGKRELIIVGQNFSHVVEELDTQYEPKALKNWER